MKIHDELNLRIEISLVRKIAGKRWEKKSLQGVKLPLQKILGLENLQDEKFVVRKIIGQKIRMSKIHGLKSLRDEKFAIRTICKLKNSQKE